MMLTRNLKIKGLAAVAFLFICGLAAPAMADDSTPSASTSASQPEGVRHHHKRHHEFRMGMCVGQTLAAEGITLPAPTAGPHTPDPTLKAAIENARQACHAQFQAAHPQSQASN